MRIKFQRVPCYSKQELRQMKTHHKETESMHVYNVIKFSCY